MIYRSVALLLLLCAPGLCRASVQITEIMYDIAGSDAGREWVEVTNTGSGAIDLSPYKLFEANTNHALTVVSGTGVLQPGASAVIADDDAKFRTDWPNYTGILMHSSFSLSNSGETIGIKDSALTLLDSVTYDQSQGAAGDGNSLQRSGSTFTAAAPTPGSYGALSGAQSGPEPAAQTPDTQLAQTRTPAQEGSGNLPPQIVVRMQADETVMVGGGSFFSAQAYGTQGMPLAPARYVWNFGDGTTAEGPRVFHAYHYPGRYVVWVDASYAYSSAVARATIEAVAAEVSLVAEGDGSLVLHNASRSDLDVGLWSLHEAGKHYVIPEHTIVLAGEGLRFSPLVTALAGSVNAELRYVNGALAAAASPGTRSPLRGERVTAAHVPRPAVVPAPALPAPARTDGDEGEVRGAETSRPAASSDSAFWFSVLGLFAVLLGGGAAAYLLRPGPQRLQTEPTADDFKLEA